MVKFENRICCSKCGRYLFTEKEVIDKNNPKGRIVRENDDKNYYYHSDKDNFVCEECNESI